MYDLIGDIHGHAEALKQLLFKMDYREKGGVWQHPERKVIFVGDYIDRGPAIRETLHIVRNMQETGHAIALMGNHEYNALAYAHRLPDGTHLRAHNAKHTHQHSATLTQFAAYLNEWQSYLEWFYTLPLFLELPELRAVHACWDEQHVQWLHRNGYETMSEALLISSHLEGSDPYRIIEDVLKGKEFTIPPEYAWKDNDGHLRTENRYKWWLNSADVTCGAFLFNCPESLREQMVAQEINYVVYPANAKPVFFGHYWLEDPFPVVQAGNVVCLDYSIAKRGNLVAYRWNGEQVLDNRHFIHVAYSE